MSITSLRPFRWAVKQEILIELEIGMRINCVDGYTGYVAAIGLSPYYAEEREGIMRVYVWDDYGLADWVLPYQQIGDRVFASPDGVC